MAIQDLGTNLSAALSQLYAPSLIRQFNRMSVLATLLPKKMGRGKNAGWDVMFTGNSAQTFADGADVATYDVDTPVPATLPWGLYRSSFSISGLAQAVAATSAGSADELMDLVNTSAENAAMKLVSLVNADLFAGTGAGTQMTGLATAVSASGTYATIAKGSFAEFQGTVLANGGTVRTLTKDLIDQLEAAVFIACGFRPTVIVCSAGVARKYEGLFDSLSRVILAGPGEISAQSNTGRSSSSILQDADGFTGLHYKGIPVYRDRNCQANTLYMLNTNFIELQYMPQPGVNTAVIAADKDLHGLPNTNMAGLAARIESMAKTGDADKFTMKLYLQLAVKRPNTCAILQDISEA